MNIFNLPVYYISFNRKEELEDKLKVLGFTDINHFKAVDGRKFTPEHLMKNKIITIRAYNDLIYNRHEWSGIPSLGAVGCTVSHDKLWEKCVKDNIPYMIILEDDVDLPEKIEQSDVEQITKILSKGHSINLTSLVNPMNSEIFFGTQIYIITNKACKELIKDTYPIDVQTDWYMSHKNNTKDINIETYKLAGQKLHKSSIQNICFKCFLPNTDTFYLILILLIIAFASYMFYKKYTKRDLV
jgi:glycosyl transferase, family 25